MITFQTPATPTWHATATNSSRPIHTAAENRERDPQRSEPSPEVRQRARAELVRRAVQAVAAAHNEAFRQFGDDAWSLF